MKLKKNKGHNICKTGSVHQECFYHFDQDAFFKYATQEQSCAVASRHSQNHESPPEHWCKGTWKIKRGKRNNPNLIFYFHPVLLVCSFTSVISSSYPPFNYPSLSPRASFFFHVTHDAFYRSIPVVSLLCKLHSDAYAANKTRCALLQLPKIWSSSDETMHTNSLTQK